jgi:large subunit ribosomal protein L21
MFAVIKTGGKQYKVAANDVLKIEKLDAAEGDIVTFDQVLMVGGEGAELTVGLPLIAGASVAAEFLGTKKQDTVLIVKKHRRQHYDRRNGHRQLLSSVRITEILLGGAKPTIAARPKKVAAPKPEGEADVKPAKKAKKAAAAASADSAPEAEASEAKPAKKAAKKAPAKKAEPAAKAAKKAPAKKAAKKADKE